MQPVAHSGDLVHENREERETDEPSHNHLDQRSRARTLRFFHLRRHAGPTLEVRVTSYQQSEESAAVSPAMRSRVPIQREQERGSKTSEHDCDEH